MPYNLSEAFEAIENELISSMMRNLKRHQAEETAQGFEWEQWQALQLQALENYRKKNLKKFPPRFNKLNAQIEEALRTSYKGGRTAQERKILKAIQMGFKPSKMPYSGDMELEGGFFGVNDRKLDALINAVDNDMSRAEYAVLRRADDQYRQTIFNAQVYANTGAGTYKKAVDMATRDFLRAGLDCVEYKNGSRHTLEDYADMAIKTANKRAYLQGEGSMRDEWGVPTVIMNKRSCPCPLCAPFVGKVFIDDVWSGGGKDGISPVTGIKYPLLSDAIAQGLYHPRCKDVHSTYFEGISTPPESSQYTADELDEMAQKYEAQQKQGYCERQEKRYDRISKYSLDEDNRRMYGARAKAYGEKAEQFGRLANSFKTPVEKSGESGIIKSIKIQDIEACDTDGIISDECRKTIMDTLNAQKASYSYDGIRLVNIPPDKEGRIEILRTNAISTPGYPNVFLELNSEFFKGKSKELIDNLLQAQNYSVADSLEEAVIHECGHLKVIDGKTYAKYESINEELKGDIFREPISKRSDNKSLEDLAGEISEYAKCDGLECIAECHVKLSRGEEIPDELKALYDKYISKG